MSIVERHPPLSDAAAGWLLQVANPLGGGARQSGSLTASEAASVLRAAELHGVLPAALRALSRPNGGGCEGSDEQIRAAEHAIADARLRRVYQAGHELRLRHHGERVLAALHAADIRAVIVKGPAAAQRLYAEPAMRPFTDIDILIPVQERAPASEILQGDGFMLRAEDYRQGKDYREDKWVLADDASVSIEVHTNLVHNPNLRRGASIAFEDVLAAGNGDAEEATALLFVACAHGAVSHQFDRLQHLADVALAAEGRAGEIDPRRLADAARRSRVSAGVYAALVVAGAAFGGAGCRRLAEALRPSVLGRLASRLITPRVVLAARSGERSGSSWRRKALRQVIRLGIG